MLCRMRQAFLRIVEVRLYLLDLSPRCPEVPLPTPLHSHNFHAHQVTAILSYVRRLRQHVKAPRSGIKGQGGHGQDLLVRHL